MLAFPRIISPCAVKAIPPEPEDERTKRLEHGGLLWKCVGCAVFIEAANAGAHHDHGAKGSDTAGHVHDAGSGEVNSPAREQTAAGVCRPGRSPSVFGPGPVRDDRVNDRREKNRVDHVRTKRGAFSHCSRHDGGGGGGERPLEEPVSVSVTVEELTVDFEVIT